ncbi:hypothetical protein BST61_g8135 [Cercospora zeina]
MGDFVDEATKPKPGLEGRDWHVSYISSDRDWHFEGSIKCSSVETIELESTRSAMMRLLCEYSYTQLLGNGRIMAFSDDRDPAHLWLLRRRCMSALISKVYEYVE